MFLLIIKNLLYCTLKQYQILFLLHFEDAKIHIFFDMDSFLFILIQYYAAVRHFSLRHTVSSLAKSNFIDPSSHHPRYAQGLSQRTALHRLFNPNLSLSRLFNQSLLLRRCFVDTSSMSRRQGRVSSGVARRRLLRHGEGGTMTFFFRETYRDGKALAVMAREK